MISSGQDRTFKSPEGEFHYVDWGGPGPIAHFAHATGFCARTYTPLAERLNRSLHVFGMDDRGHGRTKAKAHPRRLKDWNAFALDLSYLFEHLGGRVIAMGHSRGAVSSLLLAATRPELVRALVLVDPTILPYSWTWWWFLAKKIGLSRWVPIASRAAGRRRFWPDRESLARVYGSKAIFRSWEQGFLEGYLADGTEPDGDRGIKLSCDPAWESRCFATCPHDSWKYLPGLKQPTLVVYGTKSDTFLPPAVKRFKTMMPRARIVGLRGATHFVPMERPGDTAGEILRFLAENGMQDE